MPCPADGDLLELSSITKANRLVAVNWDDVQWDQLKAKIIRPVWTGPVYISTTVLGLHIEVRSGS